MIAVAPQSDRLYFESDSSKRVLLCWFAALGIHLLVIVLTGSALTVGAQFAIGDSKPDSARHGEFQLVAAPAPPAIEQPISPPEPVTPPPLPVAQPKTTSTKKVIAKLQPVTRAQPAPPSVSSAAESESSGSNAGSRQLEGTGTRSVPVAEPDYLQNPAPTYPRESRARGEEGTTIVRTSVDANGNVTGAVVSKSSGFSRLDGAALAAVLKWKFKPAQLGGIAIGSQVDVPIRFKLKS